MDISNLIWYKTTVLINKETMMDPVKSVTTNVKLVTILLLVLLVFKELTELNLHNVYVPMVSMIMVLLNVKPVHTNVLLVLNIQDVSLVLLEDKMHQNVNVYQDNMITVLPVYHVVTNVKLVLVKLALVIHVTNPELPLHQNVHVQLDNSKLKIYVTIVLTDVKPVNINLTIVKNVLITESKLQLVPVKMDIMTMVSIQPVHLVIINV